MYYCTLILYEESLRMNKFTKANILRDTKKVLNKITAGEEKFEYVILDEALRKTYPEYFKD